MQQPAHPTSAIGAADANLPLNHGLPPDTHQFDFWLGEWDLTWDGGTGSNSITRILGGHVIQERFTAVAASPTEVPLHGLSLSVFVPAIGKWRQTWVDNTGSYPDFIGTYADGRLTLAMERTVEGTPTTYRMVFYNIAEHSLDWDWERSSDGGRSWELLWRIHYRRHA